MAERRVAEVMCQSNGFTKLFVEIQAFAYGARYLGNLNAVGKAGSIIFSFVICKNLSFAVQSAKGGRMNQPVPVALERRADDIGKIRIQPAAALFRFGGISC